MRLAWYAGASTALAAAVILSAFHQRANFYSAMVYLAQSNLCLMIIINLVFLAYGSFMYGLQRVCFGQLRPVEIEQLYEKAWFAVTETCLAMTIFREEVGGFFLVMFTALVTGKVWGWIGEGRVEILEQQPPTNPRLFHTRLSVSLILSLLYDAWLLHYSVTTVIQQARPDMMVMFLFEFAILTVCSFHTALRYVVSLVEARIVKKQTQQRLEDRRRQVREEREEMQRLRESSELAPGENHPPLPNEEDVDEMDIEVPGWEAKGQWVLSLDLCADFFKLCIYATFFFVLLTFYGLPIHIMRDLFMTTRSFIKRLGALMRYRQALRDMNKYPDATQEELSRESTCIICREDMHLWNPNDVSQVERSRPKKLPCGHILHFGCLKSWLERQQVCPTCRRSVVMTDGAPARNRDAMVFRVGLNLPGGARQNQDAAAPNGAAPGGQGGGNNNPQQPANGGDGVRMFNFGPLRFGFAQGGVGEIQQMAQRLGMPADAANVAAVPAVNPQLPPTQATTNLSSSSEAIFTQLRDIEQRIQRESTSLRFAEQEAQTLRLLLTELQRIRQVQSAIQNAPSTNTGFVPTVAPTMPTMTPQLTIPPPPPAMGFQPPYGHQVPHMAQNFTSFAPRINSPSVMRLGTDPNTAAIPAGHPDLPEGVTLPTGWTLLPLQRLDGNAAGVVPSGANVQTPAPTESQTAVQQPAQARTSQQQDAAPSIPSNQTTSRTPSSVEIPREPEQASEAMAQPTPRLPNWGGTAQLFRDGPMFGYQPSTGTSTPVQQEEASSSNEQGGGGSSIQSSEATTSAMGHEGQNGSTSKGKAKAVTVEEADDDDR